MVDIKHDTCHKVLSKQYFFLSRKKFEKMSTIFFRQVEQKKKDFNKHKMCYNTFQNILSIYKNDLAKLPSGGTERTCISVIWTEL